MHHRQLRSRGATPRTARRGVAHGSGLDEQRWVVERGVAWLPAFTRLRPRYGTSSRQPAGLLQLACAPIRYRRLPVVLT